MADLHAAITSERLLMPLLSQDQLRRLADGEVASVGDELGVTLSDEWLSEVGHLAGFRARQLRDRPQDAGWLLRPIVRADTRTAIGFLNFHRAPDERGTVEIGYTLLPDARGQGYAIEAVSAAFAWAQQAATVRYLRASISPDNERSINLVSKLGLTHVGEQWDEEDGLELIYEREVKADATR
jgi:RimJ/RimL family protein N-acetyltransferase